MLTTKKNAVLVGGAQSLGAHLCERIAAAGYNIAVLDLNGEGAKNVAASINEKYGDCARAYTCDATNEQQVIDVFAQVNKDFGDLYLMVYSAGVAKSSKITNFTLKDFNFCVDVNLTGYFLCAREASRYLIAANKGGRIIQINSKSGKVGSKYNGGYSAAKFGGWGLTQSLALDLAEHDITVNALMLGNLLESDMFKSLVPSYAVKLGLPEEEVIPYYRSKVPLNRGCSFDNVADVLLFYASEGGSYCTGQAINITGGQVMH